jgi:4-alpha-glucanotransferase
MEPQLRLAIIGSSPELGEWQPERALLLGNEQYPVWKTTVNARPGQRIEYKYVLIEPASGTIRHWESGDNRVLEVPHATELAIRHDEYFAHPGGQWKGAGVAMPVFSLRTQQSCGVGEFTDIKALVDWAASVNMDMVQILPVNDTIATHTWKDSYPYAAISVFALHPLYLNLDGLETYVNKAALTKKRKALNALDTVDYEAALSYKLAYARKVYDRAGEKTLASKEFKTFFRHNQHWLVPYAAFSYFRDQYGTANFNEWPDHRTYEAAAIDQLNDPKDPAYSDLAFYYYLQYHLDRQLAGAADYARERGIVLKGDIPIGIYRYSADAWVEPGLYNMDGQAGAPPDAFAAEGQNWGFPTYDWDAMAADGSRWWKQRFTQLARYFDAFRIDHILGFFRIWETPIEQVEGILGYFNPAIPVSIDELRERGISFDYDRYCRPYITDAWLAELFGPEADYVKNTFLLPVGGDRWQFREEVSNQRAIAAALPEDKAHLEKKLFRMVSNVLLLPVPDSQATAFHPRISLFDTYSYQQLDGHSQWQLRELHDDYFYRRQEDFWREQGMTKLPAMKDATDMLICGEDLGMVPACVPDVMRDLGILSLEIQRMAKNPQTEFLQPADIPYWSVCSPSTHDMPPIRLWWEEEEPGRRQRFYNQELGWWGEAPDTCSPELAGAIIHQHLHWPAMWTVFPLQDLLAMDGELRRDDPAAERINVPAIVQYYWRYRMHLSLEDLLAADDFNGRLREMLAQAGRA